MAEKSENGGSKRSRFKSWALWLSVASLVIMTIKEITGLDISSEVESIMNVALPVLVCFGIINNPTSPKSV
jgi:uncharacterized membrane protein